MSKLELLNSILHKLGFDLARYNKGVNGILRRTSILDRYNVDLIIDVGANTGIYGKEIRQSGFKGEIVSFEPMTKAFQKLQKISKGDSRWNAYNVALGAEPGKQAINISANSHSSSILEILDSHTTAESSATYIGKEEITINTLDAVFPDIRGAAKEIYLKIDTQGFEMNVLKGALNSLKHIQTIQLELSLRPLYAGQVLYNDLMDFLYPYGYRLIDVEPGFADLKTGTLLQFDGVFHRLDDRDTGLKK